MKLDFKHLSHQLAAKQFREQPGNSFKGSRVFVRPDSESDLYQRIDACVAGREADAAFAYIGLSATRWMKFKGLCESRILIEIAEDKGRGWTLISSMDKLRAWEESVIEIGSAAVDRFADQWRKELVTRTSRSRERSRTAIRLIDSTTSIQVQTHAISQMLDPRGRVFAHELTDGPGIVQLPDSRPHYLLGCLALVKTGELIPTSVKDVLQDQESMWAIEFTADKILSMFGEI
jgi:hypothetical protein